MQILLRIRDKINSDNLLLDAKCLKRGDVVTAVGDSHVWGSGELTNPDWRIIKAVNLTREATDSMVGEEAETDPQNPNMMRQRRGFMFDFSHPGLPQAFVDFIADDTRAIPIYESDWLQPNIMALKIPRPTRRGEELL